MEPNDNNSSAYWKCTSQSAKTILPHISCMIRAMSVGQVPSNFTIDNPPILPRFFFISLISLLSFPSLLVTFYPPFLLYILFSPLSFPYSFFHSSLLFILLSFFLFSFSFFVPLLSTIFFLFVCLSPSLSYNFRQIFFSFHAYCFSSSSNFPFDLILSFLLLGSLFCFEKHIFSLSYTIAEL